MKRYLIPLLALALLAGACSSPTASTPASIKPVATVPAGNLQTAWGVLPTYRAEGNAFPFALDPHNPFGIPRDIHAGDTAVLDVLIDRDGSIRDVKVQTSSGYSGFDKFAMNRFVGARSLLQVSATDPAPYVIRQTYRMGSVSSNGSGQAFENSNYRFSDVRPMGTGAHYAGDR